MKDLKDRHVVVVSVDAMVYEDLETLSKLHAIESIWDKTARVDRVRSIYPTITYPCHSTMMTGVYPETHGIVNNELPEVCVRSSLWQHERSMVHARSLFDWAKEAGLTTAAVFWPVTGNDKNIDYLIDEYWPQHGESSEQCFRDSGSSEEVIQKIVLPNLKFVENRHRQHPWCDAFVMTCASDILREFKPNLLMVHPANVDAYRHETGLFTSRVTEGLYETALWLSEMFKAAQDAGIYEKTDFFIVSDHGQLGVRRCVTLNALLAERGLIDVDEDGKIRDYTAFAKSGGLSALVYMKNPDDAAAIARTKAVLDELRASELAGIGEVFTEAGRARSITWAAYSRSLSKRTVTLPSPTTGCARSSVRWTAAIIASAAPRTAICPKRVRSRRSSLSGRICGREPSSATRAWSTKRRPLRMHWASK